MAKSIDDIFAEHREHISTMQVRLFERVRENCPGEHKVRQFRDARVPWCKSCGRNNEGRLIVDLSKEPTKIDGDNILLGYIKTPNHWEGLLENERQCISTYKYLNITVRCFADRGHAGLHVNYPPGAGKAITWQEQGTDFNEERWNGE